MSVIGITGGISTGKTAFADCLRALLPKARFFDADEVARDRKALHRPFHKEVVCPQKKIRWNSGIFPLRRSSAGEFADEEFVRDRLVSPAR